MAQKVFKANEELILFIFMLLLWTSCKSSHGFSELELIQTVKASFIDPLGSLSSWNSSLHFCLWDGVSCDNSSRIAKIQLSGKNLSGKISEEIFQLQHVEAIDLSNNQFSGAVPRNFSNCLSLKYLNLSDNNLTDIIPRGLSTPFLQTFDLSNNMLSGEIPEYIGSYSGLKVLDIGGNVLEGRIPKSISNLTNLEFLTLASNQLVGEIPPELGLMKSLKWIYLGHNNFSGEIPKEIGGLTSLFHLDLVNNNLTGEIPTSFGNLTNLQYLFLYLNKLAGLIPVSIFGLQHLISLDLSDNFLSGEIPESMMQLQNLEVLHLFSNNLTGRIPNALSSLPHLQVLQLWSNRLSGQIPQDLGKNNNLTILDLSTNSLTGNIPESLCESRQLFKLILFSNSLEGRIPKNLGHCTSLQRIRLQNNKFSGELSPGFGSLPLVNFLDLSGNNLDGRIKGQKWNMPELQMLNLARNKFTGEIPDTFGSSKLEKLDLSENGFSGQIPPGLLGTFLKMVELRLNENKLSGEIPDELSSCKELVSLDISHNELTGKIPSSLSEMPVLSQLDLSLNQLSGEIPPKLGTVGSLVQVNISHNHFHGSLPCNGAFLAIDSSAVTGNDLCGGDRTTGLPPCKRNKNPAWWLFLTCFLSFILVVFFIMAFAYLIMKRKKNLDSNSIKMESEDGNWEAQFFSSKTLKLMRAEDIFSSTKEENLISRGLKGAATYKGTSSINDNMQFVAKVFSDTSSFPGSDQIEKIGRIDHPNIVKLIAACKSAKAAILVYEYIEGKILREALPELSWNYRTKVAIKIARALNYLHCCCSPSTQLGDYEISTQNIMVDLKDEPYLKLSFPARSSSSTTINCVTNSNKCFASSALVAPETSSESNVIITDQASDIYGFGLLLIELLTGKHRSDAEFGDHDGVVKWARYCYSDCLLETWVDPNIIRGNYNALDECQNQMVEIMNWALQCTSNDPSARPFANDLVKALESFARSNSSCILGLKYFLQ